MYKLPKEVREALLQYLQSKPYAEVAQAIKILTSLEEIKENVKK